MTERSVGLWMTLAAAVLFGAGAVVAAGAFDAVAPVGVAQVRSVMAAMLLGFVAYRRGMTSHGGRLGLLALLGINLAAVTVTFYWAIERLGVGPGTTIQFTGPVIVLVWMRLVERRAVPALAWLAAAGAVTGTGLMTRAWDTSIDPVGLLAATGAALGFASYLLLGERLSTRLAPLTVVAYGFAFSALLWVVAVPPAWSRFDTETWARLAFIGVVGTAVPFLLELSALRRADPGAVGVVATAEPLVGAGLAWIALGQSLSTIQVAGGVLTALAVAFIHAVTHRRTTWPG